MSKPNMIPTDASDRAAVLAQSSAEAFMECLAVGRLPGLRNARRAQKLARKAFRQHRRAATILGAA
jgi:hypothetical protein